MNELTTELKLLHEATLNNLKNSKANNTLRAYKSDFKDFGAFCAKKWIEFITNRTKNSFLILYTPIKKFKNKYFKKKISINQHGP